MQIALNEKCETLKDSPVPFLSRKKRKESNVQNTENEFRSIHYETLKVFEAAFTAEMLIHPISSPMQ